MAAMEFYIKIRALIDLHIQKVSNHEKDFDKLFVEDPHLALDKYLKLKFPIDLPIEIIEQKPDVLQIVYPKPSARKIIDVYTGAAMQRCGKECVDNLLKVDANKLS